MPLVEREMWAMVDVVHAHLIQQHLHIAVAPEWEFDQTRTAPDFAHP